MFSGGGGIEKDATRTTRTPGDLHTPNISVMDDQYRDNNIRCASRCGRQEKAQQLEVVRESLEAFNHPPPTTPVHSPTACRRKAAALNVLQGLCEDVGEDAGVVQAA